MMLAAADAAPRQTGAVGLSPTEVKLGIWLRRTLRKEPFGARELNQEPY
jgi:hypothetical protein